MTLYIDLDDDDSYLLHYRNEITSMKIKFNDTKASVDQETLDFIFECILQIFPSLNCLIFTESFINQQLQFQISPTPKLCSSILLKLNIYLENFCDCLYLLDGRYINL